MAFIQLVREHQAVGNLKRIYDAAMSRAGYVANIIKLMSQHVDSARTSIEFYASLMKSRNDLHPATRELLATIVSNANGCFY